MWGLNWISVVFTPFQAWKATREARIEDAKNLRELAKLTGEQLAQVCIRLDRCEEHRDELETKQSRNHRIITKATEKNEELRIRVKVLEALAVQEYDYTHDQVHWFNDYLQGLELDLSTADIPPEARSSILRSQQARAPMRGKGFALLQAELHRNGLTEPSRDGEAEEDDCH